MSLTLEHWARIVEHITPTTGTLNERITVSSRSVG